MQAAMKNPHSRLPVTPTLSGTGGLARGALAGLLAATALIGAAPAHAADFAPAAVFVEGGKAVHPTHTLSVGVTWPWQWQRDWGGGKVTGYTEGFAMHLSAPGVSGRHGYTLLGLSPIVRYRFGGGASPWFAEGGIGLSVMDHLYTTPDKQFSTRFNFIDTAAVGRSFGEGNRSEVSLRLQHISNGGIKRPNPGENFAQIRYSHAF